MNNQHYRYCFYCEKWKTKSEINEIDLGGGNQSFNCNVCRKDLGPQIIIFHCHHHPEIIMKVWGTLDNENKEKIFYAECPEEKKEESQSPPPNKIGKDVIFTGIAGILLTFFAVILTIWLGKDKKKKNK